MKRALLLVTFVLMLSSLTLGQDTPKAEIFGGYSYAGTGSHGFNGSVSGNFNEWFGLTVEASGQYSRLSDQGFTETIQTHSLLFGPRFFLRNKKVVPFVHVLIGGAHLKTETNEFGPPLSFTDNSLETALGGGLDIRLNERFALRAFQVDYLRTSFFDRDSKQGSYIRRDSNSLRTKVARILIRLRDSITRRVSCPRYSNYAGAYLIEYGTGRRRWVVSGRLAYNQSHGTERAFGDHPAE